MEVLPLRRFTTMKAIIIENCRLEDGRYRCPSCEYTGTKKGLYSHWGMVCGADTPRKKQIPPLVWNETCQFCQREVAVCSIKRHEETCPQNPQNSDRWVTCPVCGEEFYRRGGDTKQVCSYRCSNLYFVRDKFTRPDNSYTAVCFRHNPRRCVVCGEERIVHVHHVDRNRKNNHISNLVPLCPTHHWYMHTQHRSVIEDIIKKFVEKYEVKRVKKI